MDKNAIKKYAVWARNELITRVTQKAAQYEITENKTTPADADSVGGRILSDTEKKQRAALIEKIKADGFEQVMEEVAYTWFNRFTALRFMEVNNYLPSHTRVFTNEEGEFKPQILTDAIQIDLEGLNMDKVYELKEANKTEELYKYLLITQCNALSSVLPRMFQKISHYTELLLPDYLLREGSVIDQMIAMIPEEDWTDQVQIIGWLYQYYNSEPKDAVFAALKKNVKISKENIPAATQLFTPDWIVRYMVENSLGRLWLEGHPNDTLKSEWKYYLDEAEQEADVQKQLNEIRKEYAALKPEEIRCIDPCMGSGHILCYMFDVLVKIYEDYGYTSREAVENIVEKNLWGLDIDERAAQLSYFAVMMKARQYDRRFLTREIQPHIYSIEESNDITLEMMQDMGAELSKDEHDEAVKQAIRLVEEMHDAKEYGSLIHVTTCDWDLLRRFAVPRCVSEGQLRLDVHGEIAASEILQNLINIGEAISQKYNAVVTNPPYMGSSGMNAKMSGYIKKKFSDSKSDLFACFIEKCGEYTITNGYYAMITQHAWMFLSSFENLRNRILNKTIINMAHLGSHGFEEIGGEVVQTTSFVICNSNVKGYIGRYSRLTDEPNQKSKEVAFLDHKTIINKDQESFDHIPTKEIIYWISPQFLEMFDNAAMSEKAYSFQGMITGDNNYFLRLWFENDFSNVFTNLSPDQTQDLDNIWVPYNKGGGFRKWYGNNEYVLRWINKGETLTRARTENKEYYFRDGVTWSFISTGDFSCRYFPQGFLWDVAGSSIFSTGKLSIYCICGLLNSKVATEIFKSLNPTINYQVQNILQLPVPEISDSVKNQIESLVKECIALSKTDWDAFETSWDFMCHPLISIKEIGNESVKISDCFIAWEKECEERFARLKKSEEELNSLIIHEYNMGGELQEEVVEENVSVNKADRYREIKSLISYAVGCMFGRYSLDYQGIAYAGGIWDESRYKTFYPDKGAIIPICDDDYFEDDIVGRFVHFIQIAFGNDYLENNLQYIADTLDGKGTAREVIRNYFLNDFYNDHLKVYQKRPIYWMFDSGKKNGFKCLIYMHRYQTDTIARIRTDYVHEQQSRYRTAIADLENRLNGSTTEESIKLNKKKTVLQDQAEEIRIFEEKIHHLADQMIAINLDDGIKKNYALFKEVLIKI